MSLSLSPFLSHQPERPHHLFQSKIWLDFSFPLYKSVHFSFPSLWIFPPCFPTSRFVTFFFHDNKYIIGKRWFPPPFFCVPPFRFSVKLSLKNLMFSLCYCVCFIKRCILERFGPSPILHLPWLSFLYTHAVVYIYYIYFVDVSVRPENPDLPDRRAGYLNILFIFGLEFLFSFPCEKKKRISWFKTQGLRMDFPFRFTFGLFVCYASHVKTLATIKSALLLGVRFFPQHVTSRTNPFLLNVEIPWIIFRFKRKRKIENC